MGRLFLRVFLWFWLGSSALLIVLIVGFLIFQPDPDVLASWRKVGRGALEGAGAVVVNAYEQSGEPAAAGVLSNFTRHADLRAWLYGPDALLLSGTAPVDGAQGLVEKALEKGEAETRSDHRTILVARRITSDSGRNYVVVWQTPARFERGLFTTRFLLRIVSLIVTGGIVCLWLTWYITRPIRTLRGATRRFSQGDLAARVGNTRELRRGDELSDLATDFDEMAARIEELIKAQRQLLADISHELRSPLARLSLALDLARRRLGDRVPEHQRMEREIQRLDDLIQRLLTLAQLQVDPSHSRIETIDLASLVREVANDASFESEAQNKKVVVREFCDAWVRGNVALLRSAVENIVRNAVRYTAAHSEVTVELRTVPDANRVVISVRDRGPGVPPSSLGRLFDPFFRVEPARDRDSGGVGLGLAIVRQAALFHGGNVSAQNHPDGGLMVRLELPAESSNGVGTTAQLSGSTTQP